MKNTATRNESPAYASQESISQRARELWESYGRPEGRDNEIWLEAERQLLGVDSQVEGSGDMSVSARQFDESTSPGKPRTRIGKSAPSRKPVTPPARKSASVPMTTSSAKSRTSSKGGSSLKTAASDKPATSARPKR